MGDRLRKQIEISAAMLGMVADQVAQQQLYIHIPTDGRCLRCVRFRPHKSEFDRA